MPDASFLGVYSLNVDTAIGNIPKTLYYVWAESSGAFLIQALDSAHKPLGEKKSIGPATFKRKYTHETSPLDIPASVDKKWITAGMKVATKPPVPPKKPPQNLSLSPPPSVSPVRESPEQQTERYLRDVFTKSIKRCRSIHDKKAAMASIRNIIEAEEGIVTEHKFMFADFGIALRKSNLLELSLSCCKRVLDMAPEDDHAHFNAARILFEMGEFADAEHHLVKAQSINPHEAIYPKMLDYILKEQRRRWRPLKQTITSRQTQPKRQSVYR